MLDQRSIREASGAACPANCDIGVKGGSCRCRSCDSDACTAIATAAAQRLSRDGRAVIASGVDPTDLVYTDKARIAASAARAADTYTSVERAAPRYRACDSDRGSAIAASPAKRQRDDAAGSVTQR